MGIRFLTLTREDLLRLLSTFLLGAIIGGSSIALVTSRRIDLHITANEDLQSRVEEQSRQLERLEESLRTHRQRPVQSILVHFTGNIERQVQRDLERQIKDVLFPFVGRPLADLDPLSFLSLLEERVFIVAEKAVKLNLQLVVIKEELGIYLSVQPPE